MSSDTLNVIIKRPAGSRDGSASPTRPSRKEARTDSSSDSDQVDKSPAATFDGSLLPAPEESDLSDAEQSYCSTEYLVPNESDTDFNIFQGLHDLSRSTSSLACLDEGDRPALPLRFRSRRHSFDAHLNKIPCYRRTPLWWDDAERRRRMSLSEIHDPGLLAQNTLPQLNFYLNPVAYVGNRRTDASRALMDVLRLQEALANPNPQRKAGWIAENMRDDMPRAIGRDVYHLTLVMWKEVVFVVQDAQRARRVAHRVAEARYWLTRMTEGLRTGSYSIVRGKGR